MYFFFDVFFPSHEIIFPNSMPIKFWLTLLFSYFILFTNILQYELFSQAETSDLHDIQGYI